MVAVKIAHSRRIANSGVVDFRLLEGAISVAQELGYPRIRRLGKPHFYFFRRAGELPRWQAYHGFWVLRY